MVVLLPGAQLPGRLVQHEAQFGDRRFDAGSGLGAHEVRAVEHVRCRPDRDPGSPRDVLDARHHVLPGATHHERG